ncbi:ACT domain-containing protein [Psychrosphaera aquimarina]|uniref:ACT domain-containing protein n=1 Tax=Psychrosphaera aquimarina TaxID=2044854 RepID=A0ABU3QWK9_9GAMM|nr:ACT domain-containing protein [Psychrosphaera aquimarina]MDU0111819.1 ACT domain-containing protein [Psychrosphaera aquimarina]
MPKQTLQVLTETFSVHSFDHEQTVPPEVFACPIYFISKTYDELSIVCPKSLKLDSIEHEDNWIALEVLGPLGFSLTGILSNISGVLAAANVSIFAISTFDTDYILVKKDSVATAIKVLRKDGYKVLTDAA